MGYECPPMTNYFVCPHTGERFVNRDVALSLSPNCEGALLSGNLSVLTGQPSEQKGSQFWMDANPEGRIINEPPPEIKAIVNNAEYAAGWLGTYANTIPGNVQVSAAVQQIQRFPVTLGTAEVWKAVPELYPPKDVNYNTAANSPGSDNEPSYVTNQPIISGATLGTQDTTGSKAKQAVSLLSNIPYVVLGAIILIGLAILMLGGKAGRVTA